MRKYTGSWKTKMNSHSSNYVRLLGCIQVDDFFGDLQGERLHRAVVWASQARARSAGLPRPLWGALQRSTTVQAWCTTPSYHMTTLYEWCALFGIQAATGTRPANTCYGGRGHCGVLQGEVKVDALVDLFYHDTRVCSISRHHLLSVSHRMYTHGLCTCACDGYIHILLQISRWSAWRWRASVQRRMGHW